ncbi:hypothetical protein [Agrobacterium radiobacter]|uniref:hypothetical protein n=1 Tax=Agrobacterium radiobacter TaxID=362 RepID=UPI003CE4CA0F
MTQHSLYNMWVLVKCGAQRSAGLKVFISWSGDLSQKIAVILRDWLPSVIQSIEPYVSSEDIDKGTRWSSDIAGELADSFYGILCLTPENVGAPWINFEAGALSKAVDQSRVSPFLFNLKRSDVSGPLVQFQSTLNDKADILKLLESMNGAHGEAKLPADRLRSVFEVWWPHLEQKLSALKADTEKVKDKAATGKGSGSDILEEVLELVRRQSVTLNDPSKLLPPEYISEAFRRTEFGDQQENQLDHPAVRDLIEILNRFKLELRENPSFSMTDAMQFLAAVDPALEFISRRLQRSRRYRRGISE